MSKIKNTRHIIVYKIDGKDVLSAAGRGTLEHCQKLLKRTGYILQGETWTKGTHITARIKEL